MRALPLFLLCVGAGADVVSGTFLHDDDMVLIPFTVSAPGPIAMQTTSFASAGGFAPVLSLFEGSGSQLLLALDHNGGPGPGCGPRAVDPLTGYCWDAFLSLNVAAGSYLLVLTEDDNLPYGPAFTDGFLRQGNGDFTGPNFIGSPGAFYLVTGQQRLGSYHVSVTGADPLSSVPEPTSGWMFAAVGVLAAYTRLRRLAGSPQILDKKKLAR